MDKIIKWVDSEPALIYGAIGSLVDLVVAFGASLTDHQKIAIMVASGAILAVITRQKVTPVGGSNAS